jgi:hypothetical protein
VVCALAPATAEPDAAMIIAYPDLAQPTRGTRERAAPPCVRAAGFALAASIRQYELNRTTGLDPAVGSAGGL